MSSHSWNDIFFEKNYEEIRKEMNARLDRLVGKRREYAIYRFGLCEQKEHSLQETAEHYSFSPERVVSLDSAVLRQMGIRMPYIGRSSRLKKFLDE